MNLPTRVPPHNLDAEASVLGGILLRNEALSQIDQAAPEDFYDPRHREVFAAIKALEARSRPIGADALALRLAACPLPQQWTRERADRWWRAHLPEQVNERPVAEMLLAEERAPDEARELRPLRDAIR